MRVEIMTDKLTSPRNESHLVGHWPTTDSSSKVPIYHVATIHEFNRLIGYAKFKNGSHGTVLYRGQNKDYGALVPSGARPGKGSLDKSIVKAICNDELLLKFIQLNDADIAGWNEYQQVIVESIIQHYNIIDGTIVDLASQSLLHLDADFYSNGKNIGRRPNSTWERYKGYLKILIDNCKIDDTVIYPPIIRKRSSSKKLYGRKVKSS